MSFEEDNLDILQNLEATIVEVWKRNPEMTDYTVSRVYEAALEHYRSEARGQQSKAVTLTGIDREAYDSLHAVIEWRLGRGPSPPGPDMPPIPATPMEIMLECLRKLRKSVERHTRDGGRQGYLTFIVGFLP